MWAVQEIDFETLGAQQQVTVRATDVARSDMFVEKTFNIEIIDVIEADVTLANGE